jgi:hypothetical protein
MNYSRTHRSGKENGRKLEKLNVQTFILQIMRPPTGFSMGFIWVKCEIHKSTNDFICGFVWS